MRILDVSVSTEWYDLAADYDLSGIDPSGDYSETLERWHIRNRAGINLPLKNGDGIIFAKVNFTPGNYVYDRFPSYWPPYIGNQPTGMEVRLGDGSTGYSSSCATLQEAHRLTIDADGMITFYGVDESGDHLLGQYQLDAAILPNDWSDCSIWYGEIVANSSIYSPFWGIHVDNYAGIGNESSITNMNPDTFNASVLHRTHFTWTPVFASDGQIVVTSVSDNRNATDYSASLIDTGGFDGETFTESGDKNNFYTFIIDFDFSGSQGINAIRIPGGPEVIARSVGDGTAKEFRRDRPADDWTLQSTDDLGAGHQFPAPHPSGPWPAVVNMQQLPLVSDDLGRTYGAPPAWMQTNRPDLYSTARNALSWDCYAVAQMSDQRLAGFLYYDGADALYWMPGDTAGRDSPYYVTISSAARPGSGVLWPWMYVLPHGVWCVGAMRDGTYREWRSDNLSGTAWTKVQDVALTGADLSVAAMWRSVNGRQVVVGHDGTAFVAFTRVDHDGAWTGPVTVETNATAAAPYILQRRDGTWETGWLLGETWTRYTADEPSGWEICS